VFTTVGSATRQFKLYNRSTENVTIKSVKLANLLGTQFRINVDGYSANEVFDLKLKGFDSLYIFVEVTIDPDQPLSISPFILYEEIVVETEDGTRKVALEAWGQNANYFPSKDARGQLIGITCRGGTIEWNDEKPYVIYGLLFIDSCGLSISPGVKIYVHGGLSRVNETIFNDGGLFFLKDASLQSMGTEEQPIVFQGDRLESDFEDVAGQWAGIRFLSESSNNALHHTVIKNSIVGIRADSAAQVALHSCKIENTSNIGILGIGATINADNVLVHSNGAQSVALVSGGTYEFRHATLANYENQVEALYMDNFFCLDNQCNSIEVRALQATFANCIIVGSNPDELNLIDITDSEEPEAFRVEFKNSIIRIMELKESIDISTYCDECIEFTQQELFVNQDNDDYHLDTASVAIDKAVFIEGLLFDLDGKLRDMVSPDIGCYEFQ
jgi:hypothetical protein